MPTLALLAGLLLVLGPYIPAGNAMDNWRHDQSGLDLSSGWDEILDSLHNPSPVPQLPDSTPIPPCGDVGSSELANPATTATHFATLMKEESSSEMADHYAT
ncbi:hypothetical protein PCANC_06474 [Puccinia coronata f. sp. avenae]|nr:hypothetical protein PCASD_11979 [Puccinia coronata f. sp. avenae]PLW54135.1 hypothetical protein PCANC_06474 [Puccinia coronata f. sp. avenae]